MGGLFGSDRYNDVWSSSDGGVNWVEVTTGADWSARYGFELIFYNSKIYVMGGFNGNYVNDIWSWEILAESVTSAVTETTKTIAVSGWVVFHAGLVGLTVIIYMR